MDTRFVVRQSTLGKLARIQREMRSLSTRIKRLGQDYDTLADPIIVALLRGNVEVEPGIRSAGVHTSSARHPKWKQEFVAKLGQDEATLVYERTAPAVMHTLVVTPQ